MAWFKSLVTRNKLMNTLVHLDGNARACIYTEPLWGLPYNLYIPLSAKYMEALGLDTVQIGVVATVFLFSQMVLSLFSGMITDRLGRRWTTTIFDLFAWGLPLLLWMNARGFAWFVAAAALNGFMRVTNNAWSLLMVEEAPSGMLVSIYALSTIAGLLAGFAAPLTSLFVGEGNLVPTMRALYLFAFVCMMTKIVLLHLNTRETATGRRRVAELTGRPLHHAMKGSFSVVRQMVSRTPLMLLLIITSCVLVIRSSTQNFWPLLVTGKLGLSGKALPLLSALKSVGQLVLFFWIAPRLNPRYFYKPMLFSLVLIAGLHLMWYLLPAQAGLLVYAGVLLEALEMSIIIPLLSSLQILLLDQSERSRMLGFFLSLCLLITAPFGTLNGLLARVDAALPMLLSFLLALLSILLLGRLRNSIARHGLLLEEANP